MGLSDWIAKHVVSVDYVPPPDWVGMDSNGERLHSKQVRWFPGRERGEDGASSAGVRRRPRPSAPATDADVELVNGEVFEDDMIEVDASAPASHFERYRRL